jgi:hypothetical protein
MHEIRSWAIVALYILFAGFNAMGQFGLEGPTFSGIVIDSITRQPIPGATISITEHVGLNSGNRVFAYMTKTDSQGTYSVKLDWVMPTCAFIRFSAYAPGYALPSCYKLINRAATQTVGLALLAYTPADVVSGIKVTVMDSLVSDPLPGATVAVQEKDNLSLISTGCNTSASNVPFTTQSEQTTNSQGVAAFFADTIHSYWVRVKAQGAAAKAVAVGIVKAGELKEISVYLNKRRASVLGTVLDSIGKKPVKAALVVVRQLVFRQGEDTLYGYYIVDTMRTDSNGHFAIDGLSQATKFQLMVAANGYYHDSVSFETGEYKGYPLDTVRVTALLNSNRGIISGRVSENYTGKPVDSATVYLKTQVATPAGDLWVLRDKVVDSVRASPAGAYSFPNLEVQREYSICAIAPLYSLSDEIERVVAADSTMNTDVPLRITSGVEASVFDTLTNERITGAKAVVYATSKVFKDNKFDKVTTAIDSMITDSTGYIVFPLELTNPVTTDYRITVSRQGYAIKSISNITVDSAEVLGLDFPLVRVDNPVREPIRRWHGQGTFSLRQAQGFLYITASENFRVQLYSLTGARLEDRAVKPGVTRIPLSRLAGKAVVASIKNSRGIDRRFVMKCLR